MELERYNVRLPKQLSNHIQSMIDEKIGTYKNPSEFLCDLIRRHKEAFENSEQRKLDYLRSNLADGLKADESEFYAVNADQIIARAKKRRNIKE